MTAIRSLSLATVSNHDGLESNSTEGGLHRPVISQQPDGVVDGVDGVDVNKHPALVWVGLTVTAAVIGWAVEEVLDAAKEEVKDIIAPPPEEVSPPQPNPGPQIEQLPPPDVYF
ncbi:MAG TPA: hypothetical protein VGG33_23450 [Polyangia bacterium]